MARYYSLCASVLFLLLSLSAKAQIHGTVTNQEGDSLSAVNIYVQNTFRGTTTNSNGYYELPIKKPGTKILVFQYLGYQTLRKKVRVNNRPIELNVQLQKRATQLKEVVLTPGENPARRIIQNAIEHREENKAQIQEYKANYYSKGMIKLDLPEKFFGIEVSGAPDYLLDSLGRGIVYLSETFSDIKYKAPDNYYEKIKASKVSGKKRGFSFNTAKQARVSFYNNTIELKVALVSPIADYAFNYYNYKLVSAFRTPGNTLVNKIKVIPKRPDSPTFFGYIYITEDTWQIYGTDLKTTGDAVQVPFIDTLSFQQSFSYSAQNEFWVKRLQNISFSLNIFGVGATGTFTAVYKNYDFSPHFDEDTFGSQILSISEGAAEKDSLFWVKNRPVPLTSEQIRDYHEKDSVRRVHTSKVYLDSVDQAQNDFSFFDLIFGYTYSDSFQDYSFGFSSPLWGTHFNTVQGWNINTELFFRQEFDTTNTYYKFFSDMSYGFADERYRVSGGFKTKLNDFSKPVLRLEGGIEATSINHRDAIPLRINDVATIFFERNYLKLYDRLYIEAGYSEEWWNGFRFYGEASYEKRTPLINSTDHVIVNNDNGGYTSNNPLQPRNFGSVPFQEHNIVHLQARMRIRFGQKYFMYPHKKVNIPNEAIPTIYLGYEKGLGATISDYNFDELSIWIEQEVDVANKGDLSYMVHAGTFFNEAQGIALVDYQHFKGNQMRVATGSSYVGRFNLLPYYMLSTNQNYLEAHLEHKFQGWVLGKIPYVNRLNFQLIIGAKTLLTAGNKPYSEVSIGLGNLGFGNFRFLRLDYVHSFYGNHQEGALIFGLQFLGVFQ